MTLARQNGFTLIELMITVAIIGILAGIVYPSYTQYMLQARRADAQSDMLEIQLGMEKWRANNNSYATATLAGVAPNVANTYYTYSITGAGLSAYIINAAAQGVQSTGDAACTPLTLDQSGGKGPAGCWKQ